MSTVGEVIDRVVRENLVSPDRAEHRTQLTADISTPTELTINVAQSSAVDAPMIVAGTTLEVGLELMRIKSIAASSPYPTQLIVERGYQSTTATTHATGASVVYAPTVSRQKVFDAVADGVVNLYPMLYSVREAPVGNGMNELPLGATGVLNAFRYDGRGGSCGVRFIPEFAERNARVYSDADFVQYKARFPRPTSIDDELGDEPFNLDPGWERIVVLSAVADMLSSFDLERLRSTVFVRRSEAELGPLTGATQIQAQLDRRREQYLSEAKTQLVEQYGIPIVHSGVTFGR